jgi:hypothetical protein
VIYKFRDGTRVHTATLANGATEFTTYNAQREVISTVTKRGDDAAQLKTACFVKDAAHFGGREVTANV